MNDGGRGGESSNFRPITRLETLATQAMLRGEGSLETTCIRTEESLKYSIDIGIVLDEMKYGIA